MARPPTDTHLLAERINLPYKATAKLLAQYEKILAAPLMSDGRKKLIPPAVVDLVADAHLLVKNGHCITFALAMEQARSQARTQHRLKRPASVLTSLQAALMAAEDLDRHLASLSPRRDEMQDVAARLARFNLRLGEALAAAADIALEPGEGLSIADQRALLHAVSELALLCRRVCHVGMILDGLLAYLERKDDRAYKTFLELIKQWRAQPPLRSSSVDRPTDESAGTTVPEGGVPEVSEHNAQADSDAPSTGDGDGLEGVDAVVLGSEDSLTGVADDAQPMELTGEQVLDTDQGHDDGSVLPSPTLPAEAQFDAQAGQLAALDDRSVDSTSDIVVLPALSPVAQPYEATEASPTFFTPTATTPAPNPIFKQPAASELERDEEAGSGGEVVNT